MPRIRDKVFLFTILVFGIMLCVASIRRQIDYGTYLGLIAFLIGVILRYIRSWIGKNWPPEEVTPERIEYFDYWIKILDIAGAVLAFADQVFFPYIMPLLK